MLPDFSQPVSFERFMELCLYDPDEGYYRRQGNVIFGKEGDYYTSPHTHEWFAQCLVEELVHWFDVMGRPQRFQVCELGAAQGLLQSQILEYASIAHPALAESLDYVAVDIDVGTLPDRIEGVVLSNEFFDALPVRRILVREDGLWEIFVQRRGGDLSEVLRPLEDRSCEDYLKEAFQPLQSGWTYEVNLRARQVVEDLDRRLRRGSVITIDYGYTASDYESVASPRGTMACYYRHQVSDDLYRRVGEQDMTCHVHFGMLMAWGEHLGWVNRTLQTQRAFFLRRGIVDRLQAEEERGLFAGDRLQQRLRLKELLRPGGISDRMQVLVQQVRLQ